jgi:hypothetical protein
MEHEVEDLVVFVQTADLVAIYLKRFGSIVDSLLIFGKEELSGLDAARPENVGTKIKDSGSFSEGGLIELIPLVSLAEQDMSER